MLADALKEARTRNSWTLEDVSKQSGLSRSTLSRLENGETPNTLKVLTRACEAYGLNLWEYFYRWLDSQGADIPPRVAEHVRSICGDDNLADRTCDIIAEYVYIQQIHSNRHMAEAYHEITKTLAKLSLKNRYTARTDAVVLDAESAVSDNLKRGLLGSRMKLRPVFATRHPVKFTFEIHHFQPRTLGWHCAPSTVSTPAGSECFTVISGNGVLFIQENDPGWQAYVLGPGSVGSYRADIDHVWVNVSRDNPLVASAACYGFTYSVADQVISQRSSNPKRRIGGRAFECNLDDLPDDFPCERLRPLVERIAAEQ